MATATILTYKDNSQHGVVIQYLLINSAYLVEDAVKDLIGRAVTNQVFNDHALRPTQDIPVLGWDVPGIGKTVYKNLMSGLREGKEYLMNRSGGYHEKKDEEDMELLSATDHEYNYKQLGLLPLFDWSTKN